MTETVPDFLTHAQIRRMGFTRTDTERLMLACPNRIKIGRYVYVRRDELEHAINENRVIQR